MGFEPTTPSLGSGPERLNQHQNGSFQNSTGEPPDEKSQEMTEPRLKSALKIEPAEKLLDRELADAMLQMALRGMATRLALRSREPRPPN